MRKLCLSFLLLIFVLGGCARSPQRLPPTATHTALALPTFVTLPAEEAAPQLIAAEREASAGGDLAQLAQLWAEDARIVDSRGTDDPADDLIWPNRAAILDRYTLAVFPAPPPALEELPSPTVSVQGEEAQAVNGQDHWEFVRRGGRWWITELRY